MLRPHPSSPVLNFLSALLFGVVTSFWFLISYAIPTAFIVSFLVSMLWYPEPDLYGSYDTGMEAWVGTGKFFARQISMDALVLLPGLGWYALLLVVIGPFLYFRHGASMYKGDYSPDTLARWVVSEGKKRHEIGVFVLLVLATLRRNEYGFPDYDLLGKVHIAVWLATFPLFLVFKEIRERRANPDLGNDDSTKVVRGRLIRTKDEVEAQILEHHRLRETKP